MGCRMRCCCRGWVRAFGSSGTIRAIAESIRELDPAATGITPAGELEACFPDLLIEDLTCLAKEIL